MVFQKKELDLIQYLVQAAKKEKESGSKDEEKDLILKDSVVISQALASTLIFAQATRHIVLFGLYSLANNEEIQDKLYNEIIETKVGKRN